MASGKISNVSCYKTAVAQSTTVDLAVTQGSLVFVCRASVSVNGFAMFDMQNKPILFGTTNFTSGVSFSDISNDKTTLTNGTGVALEITVIRPMSV